MTPLLWLKQTCLDGSDPEGDEDSRRQGQGDEAQYPASGEDEDSRRQGQRDKPDTATEIIIDGAIRLTTPMSP